MLRPAAANLCCTVGDRTQSGSVCSELGMTSDVWERRRSKQRDKSPLLRNDTSQAHKLRHGVHLRPVVPGRYAGQLVDHVCDQMCPKWIEKRSIHRPQESCDSTG